MNMIAGELHYVSFLSQSLSLFLSLSLSLYFSFSLSLSIYIYIHIYYIYILRRSFHDQHFQTSSMRVCRRRAWTMMRAAREPLYLIICNLEPGLNSVVYAHILRWAVPILAFTFWTEPIIFPDLANITLLDCGAWIGLDQRINVKSRSCGKHGPGPMRLGLHGPGPEAAESNHLIDSNHCPKDGIAINPTILL